MGMFSGHYLIKDSTGLYWNGGPPLDLDSWNRDGVRFHGVSDALKVITDLIQPAYGPTQRFTIEEAE